VTVDQFLTSIEHDVRRFHDPGPMPTRRVVSAPTTPTWSVQPDELKVFARAARQLGIRLHSHLSETVDYVRFCREVHHCTPVEFVERNEWLGPDVWYAHLVHLSEPEIARLGATGTGMAHCPQSNGRLGSGIAPVPQMLKAGAPVSLAVDGAASNEAADMLSEAHTCWMAHRAAQGAHAISVDDVVRIGTAGGAKVLGIDGVGTLAPGMAADLAIYALDEPRHFGLHDPAVAPVASGYAKVKAVLVGGRVVAQNGAIPGLDLAQLRADAQRCVDYMRANLPS
jgi:cytosine/adenosine deaminase-related metal-dependent hydrolase